ncbi:uncharacterized protein LOC124937900 [Impatiens glandulifera]|uniref:uncharacterized protein LOC124937900 n=1 Tax=Impatiens glandulifera TaxID=253017 RepID=UPI001FB16755|nr:uncharacterized protein LOC124937900 [Impatiens glandulifera]XP_047334188.1 uncharacterized protein LOC124937900 [Impatiens glandulifera]
MGESFTIQISANLVKQLADDAEKSKKRTKRPKPKVPEKSSKPFQKINEKPIFKDPPHVAAAQGTGHAGWPQQPLFLSPPSPSLAVNAELESIRSTLDQSEKVLQKLQKQEEEMVREVTERAKDLHEKEFKLPSQKPVPCLFEKDACSDCYRDNIINPLKCAEAVKNYADCARRFRQMQTTTTGSGVKQ